MNIKRCLQVILFVHFLIIVGILIFGFVNRRDASVSLLNEKRPMFEESVVYQNFIHKSGSSGAAWNYYPEKKRWEIIFFSCDKGEYQEDVNQMIDFLKMDNLKITIKLKNNQNYEIDP